VLIGDSNAGHFVEGVIAGASETGYSTTLATMSSCPFADVVSVRNGDRRPDCDQFVSKSVADLLASPPDVVVLASASDLYIEVPEFELIEPSTGEIASSPDGKAAAWKSGLARTVSDLEKAGIDVVVVNPVPKFSNWDPRSCAAVHWLVGNGDECGTSNSRVDADSFRARAVAAESEVGAQSAATVIDFADELCPGDVCSTHLGDTWMWRDGEHISVGASAQLGALFGELLASLDR
jgi:hypothetical protein